MHFKNLEDKCRYYQELTNYHLLPNSYILVHCDGKNFSRLIKNNFKKPFDDEFIKMMNKTAKFLCENIQGCKLAYTQSDEISLLITDFDKPESDTLFGGRLCKIQSIIASLATSEFNRLFILNNLSNKFVNSNDVDVIFAEIYDEINSMKLAQFDCKAWVVPNENDAFAWFLFRNLDCIRNSKQQTAQTYLPHKSLLNKHTDKQIEILKEIKNIDWNDFKNSEKYGRFIVKQPKTETTVINNKEITYTRNKFTVIDGFPLNDLDNKEKFLKYFNNNEIIEEE